MAPLSFKPLVTLGVAAVLVIGYIVSIGSNSALEAAGLIPLFCPLKTFLSIDCPTCGLGRSLAFAFRGEWNESLNAHPLGIPFLLVSIIGIHLAWLAPKALADATERLRQHKVSDPKVLATILSLYCIWGFGRHYF